jgi:hypothetical protein
VKLFSARVRPPNMMIGAAPVGANPEPYTVKTCVDDVMYVDVIVTGVVAALSVAANRTATAGKRANLLRDTEFQPPCRSLCSA